MFELEIKTLEIFFMRQSRWPQSTRKNSQNFPGHKFTFPQVIATKSTCTNDLHQRSFHIKTCYQLVPSILADIYWVGALLTEIIIILFTQSTAVLRKYLKDNLKLLWLLKFFPEVAQNSLSIPCSEKSLSIPGFPRLWPPRQCSV